MDTDHHDAFSARHRVVIVGAGVGGLQSVASLKGASANITLIDQRNNHLSQPLVYQVATASLASSEIAWPIRAIVDYRPEVTTLLAQVVGFDPIDGQVRLNDDTLIPYYTLIRARLAGRQSPAPFRYHHDGSLAQIGKRKAVIDLGWIKLSEALAWWVWGVAHIYFLLGVRSRLSVALSLLWVHARGQRSARMITQAPDFPKQDAFTVRPMCD